MVVAVLEVWRPIPGFVFRYEVSTMGHVRRVTTQNGTFAGRVLIGGVGARGARKIDLWRDRQRVSVYVHNLVAAAFLKRRPRGTVVAFRDGNPANAALANLYYRRRGV